MQTKNGNEHISKQSVWPFFADSNINRVYSDVISFNPLNLFYQFLEE